jgi:hypothetical protein
MKKPIAEAAEDPDIEDLLVELLEEKRKRAERKKARDSKRRERGRRVVKEWFEKHPCTDCGCTDIRCLEADHLGIKNFVIGESFWRPVEQIKAELELCESRCANCHRIRHDEARQQSRELFVDELL